MVPNQLRSNMEIIEANTIAMARSRAGEKPAYSTGICGELTCGYGELDCNGYWEFPLDVNLLTET
jgi:hypothetical protein